MTHIKEVALVTNPNSSRFRGVERGLIDPLVDAGVKIQRIETQSPEYSENVARIAEELGHACVSRVIVASGDGEPGQLAETRNASRFALVLVAVVAAVIVLIGILLVVAL